MAEFEHQHQHQRQKQHGGGGELEKDPTDFYFEDPALQFPMSPQSVHQEINVSVSLAPSFLKEQQLHGQYGQRLFVPSLKTPFHDNTIVLKKRQRSASLSPGSQGTESTSSISMEDRDDELSYCGSLTYSVESVDMAYMVDDDGQVVRRSKHGGEPHNCFQLLDGVVSALKKLFGADPEHRPARRSTAYFEFDEHFREEHGALR